MIRLARFWISIAGPLLLVYGCNRPVPPPTAPVPESTQRLQADDASNATPAAAASTRFLRLKPARTGIDFQNTVDPDHRMNRLYHSGFVCGGVAVGDVDGDGLPDIYLVSGADDNRLYRQVKDLRFEDITVAAQVHGDGRWGAGAAMFDIDNDGDLDIYVCNYDAPNQLYINNGKARFTESAADWNLNHVDASLMSMPSDYDHDGDLDIFLLTNRLYRKGGRPGKPPVSFDAQGIPHVLPEFRRYFALTENSPGNYGIDSYGRPDYLMRNNGDGTFSDVTADAGIRGHGFGLSAIWWDYNHDGWADIYVCNDFDDPDKLYRNNGDGTFTDVIEAAIPHTSWFSMGSDAGDINNDGLLDFFAVDMSATSHFKQKTTMGAMNAAKLAAVAGPPPQLMRNALFINSGTQRFWESAYLSGIADSDWSWAAKLVDLDNDGWLDVFISNGMVRNFNDSDIAFNDNMLVGQTEWDIYRDAATRPEQNLALKNRGDLTFEDVSRQWGLDHTGISYGTATIDLDNDGDLDLVTVNVGEPVSIWQNHSQGNNWITVSLRGKQSNKYGIGATLQLETDSVESGSGRQIRRFTPTTGFLSSNQPIVHFGLGQATRITKLTVNWPSGITQELANLAVCQHHIIHEDGNAADSAATNPTPPMFQPANLLQHAHQERIFDDFARQPLLPNKLSQLGPGLACGDINADGLDDLFVGGAAGSAGTLWRATDDGRYVAQPCDAFNAAHEDMGALLFDADGDDDVDLYVVSGGVECEPGDAVLQDRLYVNDGHGNFRLAADVLPEIHESGGPVCAADFDRDGDLDLFVGSRVVPGRYPLSPKSQLLRNEEGKFVNAIVDAAPELETIGLVSGAVWTDINADGWIDLAVATEWGPVQIFVNQAGRLESHTTASGVAQLTGWWNGITSRDLDGDGDLDLVATNFGLNTKYHASADKPALLYYGDFEKTGRLRLVEAEFEDQKLFPIRGKSCSTAAMPFLGDKYHTYREFALADLGDLYNDECLRDSYRFAATTLESGIFENDGSGAFTFRALPNLAQIAPGFGVITSEFNGDGQTDIYLVHNFFTPQAETGRMDGGMSLLLTGQGNLGFRPLTPAESGLMIPGDAKSVVRTNNAAGQSNLIAGINNEKVLTFAQNSASAYSVVTVNLRNSRGNVSAIGARVTAHLSDGTSQTDEVRAGDGYLSQNPSHVIFGRRPGAAIESFECIWPNGERTIRPVTDQTKTYLIER